MPAKRKGTVKTRKVPAAPPPDLPQPPAAADDHAGETFDIHVHSDEEQPVPTVQAPVARRGKSRLRKADAHDGVIMRYRSDLLALNEVPPSTNVSEKTAPADLLPFFDYVDVPVPGWTEKDDWEEAKKIMMAVCSLCEKAQAKAKADNLPWDGRSYYYGGLTGSENLRRHVDNYHREEYVKHVEEKDIPNQLGSYKDMRAALEQATAKGPRIIFSQELFERYLVDFIVAHDQPINIVENPEFRRLLLLCRPDMTDDDIPHRTKVTTLVMANFKKQLESLKVELADAAGEISFTSDVWDTKARRSYMAVTAHWITSDIVMQSAVIGFARVYGRHQGTNLATVLTRVIDRVGIMKKVGKFTMDSAANNGTMLTQFGNELVLKAPDTTFDDVNSNVHCLDHTINTCSQAFIKNIGALAPDDGRDGDDVEDGDNNAGGDEGNPGPPPAPGGPPPAPGGGPPAPGDPPMLDLDAHVIPGIRNIVRSIRSSPLRRDAWDETIRTGNANGRFLPHLREVQLILDVRTRWGSTYEMLIRFLEMRPAYLLFRNQSDEYYALYPMFTLEQASYVSSVTALLKIPYRAHLALSAHNIPLLADVIPAIERFQTEWETALGMPDLASFHEAIRAGLAKATKYYNIMDKTDSYVLCMFVHPKYRFEHIKEYWGEGFDERAEALIKRKACFINPTEIHA
ncbi:hypothetical protein EVJ58_g9366 [Rhodofomes roseus]|uniref:Uncharacterized protein n=1 Tax=Rhodofomes roseus TaxID=34475 RepID=A0A4Y9XV17_9APHY|nr:hypothetical protein EVJ58_g9366 [Rhodofomes roseus]